MPPQAESCSLVSIKDPQTEIKFHFKSRDSAVDVGRQSIRSVFKLIRSYALISCELKTTEWVRSSQAKVIDTVGVVTCKLRTTRKTLTS